MPSFEIPDIPPKAALKTETQSNQSISTGAVTFTVTNKTSQGLAGRVTIEPQGEAKAEWFSVDGESERQFIANGTHTFTVRIKTPPEAKAGAYSLKVRAVAVNDPDNDFAESPVVAFDIAAPPPPAEKKKLPWWIFAAIGGGVAVVAGVVVAVILFTGGDGSTVPNVVGAQIAQAEATLTAAKFTVVKEDDAAGDQAPGIVTGQDPAEGAELDEGGQVTLKVAQGVDVLNVVNQPYAAAESALKLGHGFKVQRVAGPAGGKPPETVVSQDPMPPARAARGGTVKLTVDPGVAVPGITIPTTQQNAVNALQAAGLGVRINGRCQPGVADQVIAIGTAPGTMVAKGGTVDLFIRVPPRNPLIGCGSISVFEVKPNDRFLMRSLTQ
ncbi:MAG: PASTA domain-containing protein [Inquilinus limosus]|uniref:PASTA domain-containing protein n=1 Tax=Inquilinus limosus TaxID=171674 RepID=A0A952FNQ0_9PROT|nr:PASTA domain-containing protein [Inquilinus limosus]